MLTTKDLELVRCVAESGSLTAAARDMHITQSAVSQRLANLHARLNVTLIERRDGHMQLTRAGDRVFAAAKIVGDELNSAITDINRLAQERSQQLRIATQCYTCYRWLPFVIAKLRDDHPALSVDIVPEATDTPYDALRADLIDVAIVSNPDPGAEFPEAALFSDELFAVMSSTHELANEKYLDAAHFASETLILYTGDRHAIVEHVLTPADVTPLRIIQVRMTEAIIELARSGHGIAVIAGWALNDIGATDGLSAVRITKEGFTRNWRAVIGAHCNEAHIDSFLRRVRSVGAVIQDGAWRANLQAAAR